MIRYDLHFLKDHSGRRRITLGVYFSHVKGNDTVSLVVDVSLKEENGYRICFEHQG